MLRINRPNHCNEMVENLSSMFECGQWTDTTLMSEGKTLRAHRLVLISFSKYFRTLFETLSNDRDNQQQQVVVVMKDIPFEHIEKLLDFMYNGDIKVPKSEWNDLLQSAQALGINGITNIVYKNKENEQQQQQLYHFGERQQRSDEMNNSDRKNRTNEAASIDKSIVNETGDGTKLSNANQQESVKRKPGRKPKKSKKKKILQKESATTTSATTTTNDSETKLQQQSQQSVVNVEEKVYQRSEVKSAEKREEEKAQEMNNDVNMVEAADTEAENSISENSEILGVRSLRKRTHVLRGAYHPCPLCQKRFSTASVAKNHIRAEHLNHRFVCEICDEEFKWQPSFSKHKKIHRINDNFNARASIA
ncbi:hypothetical protein B4U79_16825 [Dinothrombium tinctorium]|uniref:Uncharacterized protein n=1 Tax=Dinothrombium tinctorium TaxID=1965070 RepID=A0A3S3PP13_9ACAR|nr:hypothetical protein B4U79_16825 [Dinothrombium tinctorium]